MVRRYAVVENDVAVNVVVSETALEPNWIQSDTVKRGDLWDGTNFITPEPEPEPVVLDALSTDKWTIPADAATPATVTYTSEDTVYFSVNEISHAVEPVDYVATLEVTADSPGPIRVEVKAQQIVITALEV